VKPIERVAYAICMSDGWSWEMAGDKQKQKALVDARTILSAFECGQTFEDAARRLAMWDAVDAKKKGSEARWDRRSEREQEYFLKRARYGFLALQSEPPVQGDGGA